MSDTKPTTTTTTTAPVIRHAAERQDGMIRRAIKAAADRDVATLPKYLAEVLAIAAESSDDVATEKASAILRRAYGYAIAARDYLTTPRTEKAKLSAKVDHLVASCEAKSAEAALANAKAAKMADLAKAGKLTPDAVVAIMNAINPADLDLVK